MTHETAETLERPATTNDTQHLEPATTAQAHPEPTSQPTSQSAAESSEPAGDISTTPPDQLHPLDILMNATDAMNDEIAGRVMKEIVEPAIAATSPTATSSPDDPAERQALVIESLTRQYVDATMEVMRLEEEAGEAKKALKDAQEHQHDLAESLRRAKQDACQLDPDGNERDPDEDEPEPDERELGSPVGIAAPASQATVSAGPPAPEPWRAVSVVELKLSKIKGMGRKKRDLFAEHVPTLGALEDLREQAGKAFRTLADMLPKGIGREMADAIEEAHLTWLTENRDRYEAPPASESPTPEPSQENTVASTVAAIPSDNVPLLADDEILPSVRLSQLLADPTLDPTRHTNETVWEAGRTVRREEPDADLDEACCWSGGPRLDNWLLGWIHESQLALVRELDLHNIPPDEVQPEPEPEPARPLSLDDLFR